MNINTNRIIWNPKDKITSARELIYGWLLQNEAWEDAHWVIFPLVMKTSYT